MNASDAVKFGRLRLTAHDVCTQETRATLMLMGWLPDIRGWIYHPGLNKVLDAFGAMKTATTPGVIRIGPEWGTGSWDDQWELDCKMMIEQIKTNGWF